ncbi:MAG: cupin domain-containing protein [Candidatus Coatesbacteria bacterium]|nr:cupin domain-containing protein [Candidatus Coatesbacteria bacterium]
MTDKTEYNIHTDIAFEPLERIDVDELVKACKVDWFNQTLCKVNDSVVRLGILKGEFHWHQHDAEDEFFYVLDGNLSIDLEDKTIELGPNQGTVIPKGVSHRPRAPEKTIVLMVETASVTPTGDD